MSSRRAAERPEAGSASDVRPVSTRARAWAGSSGSQAVRVRIALAAVLGAVLAVTLAPGSGGTTEGVSDGPFCLLCGADGTANLVRNVVLFLPVGVALAWNLGPGLRAVAAAAALTAAIETAQLFLPGRSPLVADVAANALGGAAGVALVRWGHSALGTARRIGGPLSLAWALGAGGLLLATHALFTMALPSSTYYGQWTPSLGHLETYRGEVVSARVGEHNTASRRLDDSAEVRRALLQGESVAVTSEVGPPTPGVAPVFAIHDEHRREIVLVGVDGEDLVARFRQRAHELGFRSPDVRWRDAMSAHEPGDTVRLEFAAGPRAPCLRLEGRERCDLGPRVEEGWGLLLFVAAGRPTLRASLDFLWMAALFFPFAVVARRHPATAAGALVLGGVLAGGALLPALAPSAPWALGGGAVGLLAGAAAAGRFEALGS